MNIHIQGGRVVDPAQQMDQVADVFIADGKIAAIGKVPDGFKADRTLDARGCVVCPGLVDLSARLREPGNEYRANLESEMAAAVAGGVTSLACPPDTEPVLDEPGLVEMLVHRARTLNLARVYPHGALTVKLEGKAVTEMGELAEAGCVAFSQANQPVRDTLVLFRTLQYAATFEHVVWLQPTDSFLSQKGVAHDGEVASRLGLAGIPVLAETVAIATVVQLMRESGARVHLARISSAAGLALVQQARAEGLPISCDVNVHHLHLSDMDIGFFNPHCRMNPPLRSQADRDALRRGLANGQIDAVCSDHTPVDDDAKQLPFAEAEPGATGLELLLPLTLKWGQEMKLSLPQTLARITCDAARVLGIDAGHLRVGAEADVCIFEADTMQRVTRDSLRSHGKNSPFLGYEVPSRVRATLVSGQVVFQQA